MLQPKFTDALSLYKGKNGGGGGGLTLGIKEIDDRLLGGGIEPGTFAIFHGPERQLSRGNDKTVLLDLILYRLLVNSLRPTETLPNGSRPILLNCGDYHNTQALLDLQLVTSLLKNYGLSPSQALDRIIVVSAFNPEQAEKAVDEVRSRLKSEETVGPVLVRDMPRLFLAEGIRGGAKLERMAMVQHLIARLWQTCAQQHISLVISTSTNAPLRFRSETTTSDLPAGTMLKHMAQIMISLRPLDDNVEARLWKHPYMKPGTVRFGLEDCLHSDPVMGRLSPAFRDQLQREIQALSRSFRQAMIDPERREAFDSLVKVWISEKGSMSHAEASSTLEVMLLSALVDNRKMLANIQKRIERLESRVLEEEARVG